MIGRVLAVTFLAGAADILFVLATREPREPEAVAALLVGVGLVTFALAAAAHYYLPARLRRTRRRPRAAPALRRGALLGVGVAALAFLRAVDALSIVTAAFVVAALAALEGVLSARG